MLAKIVETKKEEVKRLQQTLNIAELEQKIADLPPCRGFRAALKERSRRAMGLIAEVKKASPSKGVIRADFDPVRIAKQYEQAGADCLSVLTDEFCFQGSNTYLQQVRAAVDLPILRKDFTIDAIQIYEARSIGADAILLIAAILDDEQLRTYSRLARQLGMDALVEVHDRRELERALAIGADLIGINNRDLRTFHTTLRTSEQLLDGIPDDVTKVSESGISQPEEIAHLLAAGADAVLVGEHFMRQPDPANAVTQLLGAPHSKGAANSGIVDKEGADEGDGNSVTRNGGL